MGIYLNPKNAGFKRAVDSEIYVDKTDLIKYTNKVLGTEQGFILNYEVSAEFINALQGED